MRRSGLWGLALAVLFCTVGCGQDEPRESDRNPVKARQEVLKDKKQKGYMNPNADD